MPRKPGALPPNTKYGPTAAKAWGRGYTGPPIQATGDIATQVGTNAALAKFFSMVLEERYQTIEFNREKRAQKQNDYRDHRLGLENRAVDHEYQVREQGYRDAFKDGDISGEDYLEFKTSRDGAVGKSGIDPSSSLDGSNFLPSWLGGGDSGSSDGLFRASGSAEVSGGGDKPNTNAFKFLMGVANPFASSVAEMAGGDLEKGYDKAVTTAAEFPGAEKAAETLGDGLLGVIDVISRPIYGINRASMELSSKDDDPTQNAGGLMGALSKITEIPGMSTITGLQGASPLEGIAGIDSFGDILDVGKAYAGGIWDEGWKPEHHKNVLGNDVVKYNADRDGKKDVYDSKQGQLWFGLANDIVMDPLNLIGVGVPSTAAKMSKAAQVADRGRQAAIHATADALVDTKAVRRGGPRVFGPQIENADTLLTPSELVDLLGGGRSQFRNIDEKLESMEVVQRNTDRIIATLEDSPDAISLLNRGRVEKLRQAMHAEREAVVAEYGQDAYLSSIKRELNLKVNRGDLPESAIADLDHTLRTAAVANVIPRAREYEAARKAVAKKFNAKSMDDVEKRYENMVELVKKGKNPPKDMEGYKFPTQVELDDFTRQLDSAFDEIADVKSINDLLGPAWKHNYAISDDEGLALYRMAEDMAWKDTEFQRFTDTSQILNNEIKNNIKALNNPANASKKGKIQGYLSSNSAKKGRVDRYKDMVQADIFVRLVDTHIKRGAGEKVYRDAARAEDIKAELAAVERDLVNVHMNRNVGENNIDEFSLENAANLKDYELTPDTPKIREDSPGSKIDPEREEFTGADDYHWQNLVDRKQQLQRELEKLNSGLPPSSKRMLTEVPEILRLEDGSVDVKTLRKAIKINKKSGTVDINVSPEHKAWADDVAQVLDLKYQEIYGKARTNAQRRLNEETQAQGVVKDLSSDNQEILSMFSPRKGYASDIPANKGNLFAYLEHNGEQIFYGSPEAKEQLASLIAPADPIKSERLYNVAKRAQNGETKFLGATDRLAIKEIEELLVAEGRAVPIGAEKVANYVATHVDAIKEMLDPANLAFHREFKKTHGMSLSEARIMRDRALGNIADGPGPWHKHHPKGITRDEFIQRAMGTKAEFERTFSKAPFALSIHDVPTERIARTKGQQQEWFDDAYLELRSMPEEDARRLLNNVFQHSLDNQKASRAEAIKEADIVKAAENKQWLEPKELRKIEAQAEDDAWKFVEGELQHNKLYAAERSSEVTLPSPVGPNSSEDDLFKALQFKRGNEYAQEFAKANIEKRGATAEKVKQIDQRLNDLKERHAVEAASDRQHLKKAKQAKVEMRRRLKEEALLRVARIPLEQQQKHLSVSLLGTDILRVPTSRAMFKAAEKAGKLPVIKGTRQLYADKLKAPASTLPGELQLARHRFFGNTPKIIEHHVQELKATLGRFDKVEREATFHALKSGAPVGSPELAEVVNKQFDAFLPYFKGEAAVGDTFLSLDDINKYLPKALVIPGNPTINTPRDLLKAMQKRKNLSPAEKALYKDPYAVSWEIRVALEQAMARKALTQTVRDAFGVKRVMDVSNPATKEAVEGLHKLGWRTVGDLGDKDYFPPELAGDIEKLLKMIDDPVETEKIGRMVDKATGYWKTAVTIYNPGYYTRNAIGETMSSWFAGVNDPRYYQKAISLVKYARHDGKELEAIKSHMPLANHVASNSEKGARHAITVRGKKYTYEDVWVAYNDQGLKTGFISTERDTVKRVNSVTRANDKVRSGGEWFEDYFRMAHFMHAMEKSNAKDLAGAANHAAQEVRKYHFDYTDFTDFEKTTMLRAFPFYKWTRKALPLMSTMLFTKPGKVMVYPKTMNTWSNAVTPGDMVEDDNGYMPNYGNGMVPSWMQDMWAYQIAEDVNGDDTFFNMATPQMDIYKQTADPLGTVFALLNPLAKLPLQEAFNSSAGPLKYVPGSNQMDIPLDEEGQGWDPRDKDSLQNFLRLMPQTNMVNKVWNGSPEDKDNALLERDSFGKVDGMDEQLLSFLSGLGFYENNPARQQGEMMRRNAQ